MITANIASVPDREEQLIKTIDSLINQVDQINLCLNNYTKNPYIHHKVNVVFSDNKHGDAGKFMFVEACDDNTYYFSCDDDLIYPENYIHEGCKLIDQYKIISYHGRTFLKYPIESYYRTPAIRHQCLATTTTTEPVHIAGTGVMGFNTKYFKPPFSIFKEKNMSDIWIGCYAKELGLNIWAIKHLSTYFKYQTVPNTIHEAKVDNCSYETQIVNECFMKHGVD